MRRMLSPLSPVARLFLADHRGRLLVGALLALSTVLAGMALLAVSGWFITATALAGLSVTAAYAFDVFAPAAGIRFLALARTASRYGERIATHDATLRVLAGLRERVFRGVAVPGAAQRLILQPALMLHRLTSDIDALDSLYLRIIVPASVALLSALMLALALAFIDPLLGLGVGLLLAAAGLSIPLLAARGAMNASRRRAKAIEVLRAKVIDLVSGRTDLLMTGRMAAQQAAIMRADGLAAREEDRLNRIEARTTLAFGLVSALLLAATLWFVGQLVEDRAITAPVAALAVLAVMAGFEPFAGLKRGALEFGRTLFAARRIAPDIVHEPATTKAGQGGSTPALYLDNVSARYPGAALPVLNGVSFRLEPGERIAITGASGAGKSTLLGLLAGELEPEQGTVSNWQSALMTQRTELFKDSLRDNLLMASPAARDDVLRHALSQAGLAVHVAELPAGLDTLLGEGGTGLSAGQARRLSLARLILHGAPLWLLDEPTEGVDGATARDILGRLAGMRDITVVIATHMQREAAIADRIILLENGRMTTVARRGESEFQRLLERLRSD
ncbi:ATP-binding cassette subfamily C protein CydC [Pararhizobium capsulatum DSM 1112]|uniref:ATP-binding cassette subfamily C protein CydC n=1 Tax=Pararhizobium capsulatum DSM 1112 TaxID=1121113 RepID=A0ABU0BXR9_9HYPH|nr:thiol reductant ABC exporter subunit CydC [Pararhizobium capsulatum]MDQ0322727.1 ATP-binding cassette subfamily C protein CydC [Pararhizobium capsulatum DSM 1112]